MTAHDMGQAGRDDTGSTTSIHHLQSTAASELDLVLEPCINARNDTPKNQQQWCQTHYKAVQY